MYLAMIATSYLVDHFDSDLTEIIFIAVFAGRIGLIFENALISKIRDILINDKDTDNKNDEDEEEFLV